MVVLALVISGRVIFQFLPSIEGDTIYAQVRMPAGVPAYLTEQAAELIEEKALELRAELEEEHPCLTGEKSCSRTLGTAAIKAMESYQ